MDWVATLPFRKPPLSGNSRWSHWAQERNTQHEVQRAVWALAKRDKVPSMAAVTVELVWYPGRNGRYDSDNIAPTLKPAIDGLVQAGVLPDDDSERVIATSQRVVIRKNDPYDGRTGRVMLIVRGISTHDQPPHYAPQEAAR